MSADENGWPRIRILAYVKRLYRSPDFSRAPEPTDRCVLLGYWCDVTVEVQWSPDEKGPYAMVQNYAQLDGEPPLYQTFEEVQQLVEQQTGIVMEPFPEDSFPEPPEFGSRVEIVAAFVREFVPTAKPREQVEPESGLFQFVEIMGQSSLPPDAAKAPVEGKGKVIEFPN